MGVWEAVWGRWEGACGAGVEGVWVEVWVCRGWCGGGRGVCVGPVCGGVRQSADLGWA